MSDPPSPQSTEIAGNTKTRNPMVEQDNAPGGDTTGPGQSLLHATIGYRNLSELS
jgi:hypothetical protein